MRKVILYSACSLDNFIAKKDGTVDWLFTDNHYGYYDFYATIDTILMGNKTYEQVLSFGGDFPYKNKKNFVFTRNTEKISDKNVVFIAAKIESFVQQLKQHKGKDIWLVGGGQINTLLLNAGLVDEMVLSIHPTILGEGIALFEGAPIHTDFVLTKCETFPSGLVQLFLKAKSKK